MKIGIVLAKGESTEIPNKNKRDFCGKPLCQWTIEQALASDLDHVVVSSDDDEILAIAERSGADAVRRPSELCDGRHMLEAEQQAIESLGLTSRVSALFRLQPTSPLRLPSDINAGLKLLEEWPAVVSVTKPNPHIFMQWRYWEKEGGLRTPINNDWRQPRQGYPNKWMTVHGAVICARYDYWQDGGYFHEDANLAAYEMPPERSVDIDSEFDWNTAEWLARQTKRFRGKRHIELKLKGGCVSV